MAAESRKIEGLRDDFEFCDVPFCVSCVIMWFNVFRRMSAIQKTLVTGLDPFGSVYDRGIS